ncbi:hypothetical protein EV13_2733 [Prochlorococcus sp. MIT 0702]|nr:hypothetical protein EV13_2733 [Prochlorococcus sp. MIT 0702]
MMGTTPLSPKTLLLARITTREQQERSLAHPNGGIEAG